MVKRGENQIGLGSRIFMPAVALLGLLMAAGCATTPKLMLRDTGRDYPPQTIISAASGEPVDFEALIAALSEVDVVYVGERHTDPEHHAVQLRVLRALHARTPDLVVGMEMFDRSYQSILDRWSTGSLKEADFLRQTHWYANWKYDYELYRPILDFVRKNRIALVGINLPFHLPAKIAAGGLENLADSDRLLLAAEIDTGREDHRAYVEKIFKHHRMRGGRDFESFYQAQCAWEDTMAESVARITDGRRVLVLVGNGHIVRKFGIPERAFRRNRRPYATVYPARVGGTAERLLGDYIWVTP